MSDPEKAENGIRMEQVDPAPNGSMYMPPPDYGDGPPTILNAPAMPGTVVTQPTVQGDWWAEAKVNYRTQWRKTDPVLPAQPAGLGLAMTAASLAGNLTGVGMVAIPFAFVWMGWSAIFALPFFGALAAFNASLLKSCCEMLEERYEEYRRFHWYTQYTDIAHRALGPGLGKVVSALRLLCIVGLWAVAMIIASDAAADYIVAFIPTAVLSRGYAYCGLVTGYALFFALFSGPMAPYRRYWCGVFYLPFALVLMGLLLAGMSGPSTNQWNNVVGPFGAIPFLDSPGVLYCVGWGIMAFNFAGVCGLTNIRRDMKSPPCFTKAAAIGISGTTLILFVVGVTGYSLLALVSGNVVLCLNERDIRLAAHFFVIFCADQAVNLAHLIREEHERVQDYGKRMAWSRVKLSSPLALCAGLLALAVPYEEALMALVGSMVVCPVAFVLPPVFYYKLCQGTQQWPEKPISMRMKIALGVAVFSGLLVFLGGTVTSIIHIAHTSRMEESSCFWNFWYDAQYKLAQTPSVYSDIVGQLAQRVLQFD